jgi:hypothetical protein
MVDESTIVVIACVSFVNAIPILSGRMDFGDKKQPGGRSDGFQASLQVGLGIDLFKLH